MIYCMSSCCVGIVACVAVHAFPSVSHEAGSEGSKLARSKPSRAPPAPGKQCCWTGESGGAVACDVDGEMGGGDTGEPAGYEWA